MQEQETDKTFKEQQGVPANAHAKKLNKQFERVAKLKSEFQEIFYTLKDGKILKVVAKPNGAHSTFIGSKVKMDKKHGKETVNAMIRVWEKEGCWLPEHLADDKLAEAVANLDEKYQAALAKKKGK